MAILQMKKIRFYVHAEHTADALRVVQELGFVEFEEVSEKRDELVQKKKTAFEYNYVSSRLDQAVIFLTKYATGKGKIRGIFEGDRISVTEAELASIDSTFHYNEIVDAVQDIEKQLVGARVRITKFSEEKRLLQDWETLSLSLNTPRRTEKTQTHFVKGDSDSIGALQDAAHSQEIPLYIDTINAMHHIVMFLQTNEAVAHELLSEHSLEVIELPMRRGTPAEEIERITRAIVKEEEIIAKSEARAGVLAKELPNIMLISDVMYWHKNKHDVISTAVTSGNVSIFEGWCPETKLDQMQIKLQKVTIHFAIEKIVPSEDERPPVEIENNAMVKPFEMVTRLYGLPGHKDIDPTMFLASFFFIFFGLSLTDVGYGVILMLASGLGLAFFSVPKEAKPPLQLFFLGGISSVIVGIFFGGYLGFDMQGFPQWVQSLQQFDPIKNPIPVFYLALAFGIVHILTGLVLRIVREAKNGNWLDGVLDTGPWIALFIALILWGAGSAEFIPGGSLYLYIVYTALASLVLTQGRKEKNIAMKLFKGVFSIYDSIGYLSDVLSYSRLLALGLATSALAFAVNLIAEMVSGVPYVGWLLMILILIVGHLFNLAVNVLGAFVHSARLQFVEFFGKFITESGRIFKPFKREQRYVSIR